jgi:glycosyltransferase involved in cell wall biosynthesis
VRLAVLTSGFPRRSETFALNELLALDRAGVLAAIFATKPGDGGAMQPGVDRLMGKVRVLKPGGPQQQAQEVVRRLEGTPVSGMHAYFAHRPAEVAEQAASRLAVPYSFGAHALDARRAGPVHLARRARAAVSVIACNSDVARELERLGAAATLMPHGVDLRRFPSGPEPRGELRLLAVGRLVAKKGFSVLIEAAARLSTPFRLRIIGGGPEHDVLRERIAALGLRGRVQLAGLRTHAELADEFAAAHIVVVPSVVDANGDRDGLPNVVLEAMACGRPVVASDVGAVASAVVDDATGTLVAPGDVAALTQAIELLAGAPRRRERLGRAGRAHVEREYGLEACTARLLRHLEAAYA